MATRGQELDDDIPPLEDMTEYVEKAKALRAKKGGNLKAKPIGTAANNPTNEPLLTTSAPASSKASDGGTRKESPSSFGGFKKGFLFSNPEKKSQKETAQKQTTSKPRNGSSNKATGGNVSETAADIPFIRAHSSGSSTKGLELPEVQEAMKNKFPFLQTQEWMTDDLLNKISSHPLLSKVFQEPRLAEVLSQFQSNPQAALAAASGNPEMQQFLQEFCSVMGDHFTALADKEEREKKPEQPLIAETTATGGEEVWMREVLGRPGVQRALADPEIQKFIIVLKNNPDEAQRILCSSSPTFHQKLKILIDSGILAVQRV